MRLGVSFDRTAMHLRDTNVAEGSSYHEGLGGFAAGIADGVAFAAEVAPRSIGPAVVATPGNVRDPNPWIPVGTIHPPGESFQQRLTEWGETVRGS
jgi:hypothetical protein